MEGPSIESHDTVTIRTIAWECRLLLQECGHPGVAKDGHGQTKAQVSQHSQQASLKGTDSNEGDGSNNIKGSEETIDDQDPTEVHWAENRLSDFNLWDAGVGASAKAPNSLDYRLRDDELAKKVVIGALQTLLTWIIMCRDLAHSSRPEGKDEGKNNEEAVTLKEARHGVEELLGILIQLGVAIRQGSAASHLRNADRSFLKHKHEYAWLIDHLTFLLQIYNVRRERVSLDAQETTEERIQTPVEWRGADGPNTLGFEQQVLLNAIVKRHHRFVFAKQRRDKLGVPAERSISELASPSRPIPFHPQPLPESGNNVPVRMEKETVPGNQGSDRNRVALSHRSNATTNQVSTYEAKVPLETVVEQVGATAPPTAIALKAEYPEPPRPLDGAAVIVCPYCFLSVPIKTTEKPRWKKHLSEDLQPYTCYLPDCPHGNLFFNNFEAWKKHVFAEHQAFLGWTCFKCEESTNFTQECEFRAHVGTKHEEVVAEEYLDDFSTACRVYKDPTLDICPVCSINEEGWKIRKKQDIRYDSGIDSFLDHIGSCMHDFALRALPSWGSNDTAKATTIAQTGASNLDSRSDLSGSLTISLSGKERRGLTEANLLGNTQESQGEKVRSWFGSIEEELLPPIESPEKYWLDEKEPRQEGLPMLPKPDIIFLDGEGVDDELVSNEKKPRQEGLPMLPKPDIIFLDEEGVDDDLLRGWEFNIDNTFAEHVVERIGAQTLFPTSLSVSRICESHKNPGIWAGNFAFEETLANLADRVGYCDFCKMLYETSIQHSVDEREVLRFEQDGSTLRMTRADIPVLSIFQGSEIVHSALQIGLPKLPNPGAPMSFEIIKTWLEDCDSHNRCSIGISMHLPTRLIDVGTQAAPQLCLVNTGTRLMTTEKYIFLSCLWGTSSRFSTKKANLGEHERDIPYEKLPATYQHAVRCTRALRIRYLYIDAFCIIQDDAEDVIQEVSRMEEDIHGAYCVIAATRATDQRSGFLGSRRQRGFVTIEGIHGLPLYLCPFIDDFQHDILEAPLHRRGWTLREHALARRTIFFAENQMYFECGEGVRCETLTRMRSEAADILGDPNFPQKAAQGDNAHRIRSVQELYKTYSRLALTRSDDRPKAIAGLEKRILKAFGTPGGYGIFGDEAAGLFHQSLLWRRANEIRDMTPIVSHEGIFIAPSWSWMAYQGPIDYLYIPIKSTDWSDTIQSPWRSNHPAGIAEPDSDKVLKGIVRSFSVSGRGEEEFLVFYDSEALTSDPDGQRRCLVVASSRGEDTDEEKTHDVLLVAKTSSRGEIFRRIGVGCIPGKFIDWGESGVAAIIR